MALLELALAYLHAVPYDLVHGVRELVLRNEPVTTPISLLQQLCPYLRVHACTAIRTKNVIEVVHTDLAVLVVVENLERLVNLFCVVESLSVYACRDKFLEIYAAVTVLVQLGDDLIPVYIVAL